VIGVLWLRKRRIGFATSSWGKVDNKREGVLTKGKGKLGEGGED